MIEYRGYRIGQELDYRGTLQTVIESPCGQEAWYTDKDPRDGVDEILDGEDSDYVKDNRMLQREFV